MQDGRWTDEEKTVRATVMVLGRIIEFPSGGDVLYVSAVQPDQSCKYRTGCKYSYRKSMID